MSIFASEFPVRRGINRAEFLSQVIAWLRGNKFSRVLDETKSRDLDASFAHLKAENGEVLIFRELADGAASAAIGFRHDMPDEEGRLWRTEAVLLGQQDHKRSDLIRLRTQCIATGPTVREDVPKKPYLIKTLIKDGWGEEDGLFTISDGPIWLSDDQDGLEAASAVTNATATHYLPVVYVSATAPSKWAMNKTSIEKLAYELGGIAHVVVEPSRAFSFDLREITHGTNVYGGSVGISVPKHGMLRQLFIGHALPDEESLHREVGAVATAIRSQMAPQGWDWIDLQEASLRDQRTRERNRLSSQDIEAIYLEEIKTKEERIKDLELQLSERPIAASISRDEETLLDTELAKRIGIELYPGEFSDRVRASIKDCLVRAENDGLDKRSCWVLSELLKATGFSDSVDELREELKRATKDPKKVASLLQEVLKRHGYAEKSDNKHIRMEPKTGFDGLDNITLPKTPSDHRGLLNLRKQIEKTLGVSKLSD
ncbi:MAG TPA: hypothetical protein DCW88_26280 [Agrobacterium sp.]|uniref:hypothetical protein n=1 Tax=Agrobacterium pusense TaxID=648995 RepID=UPI000E897A50|nr:hypothetical protein [Agrobacterium pusense]MDH0869441.1 hypothetical protein [Agrobacterium pusense]MDH1267143.1 hypothetical protein [Agrobacterium pusense]HAU78901.1 hypothetical protein [Agrobacterium sp.]